MTRGLFIIAVSAWLGADASAQRWQELGPSPNSSDYTGRVSAIAASPTTPGRIYVGGADGGVWRTDDGGLTWTPLTDGTPTTSIGAVAIDPTDERTVYAGTGEANYANHSRYGLGVLKTTDGGATWTLLGERTFAGRCISRIVVAPDRPSVVYAAVTRAGGFPELAAAKGHPGATGPRGVFRSTDGGVTWNLLPGLPDLSCTDLAMDPQNSRVLYAAVGRIFGATGNGIYKTTDGGTTWTKLGGGLPTSDVGRISIAVAPTDGSRIYALVTEESSSTGGSASTRGAWRSSNGGQTWSSLGIGSIQATYGWYLCTVGVDPTDKDTVLFGGLTMVRSTNAGVSFSTVTPPHVDLHAITWDAAGALFAGSDGGVYRSTSNGSSWSARNDGLGLIQFYAGLSTHPTDDAYLVGGTQDNGTNQTGDSGTSWQHVFGGDGGWTQVDPVAPSTVFAEFQGTANLYKSTNGGSSFSWSGSGISSSDRNCFLPPYLIDPTQPSVLYYATHRIWRSTNGGSSWNVQSGDLTAGAGAIRSLALAPSDPSVLYAATNDGRVLVSSDFGQSFILIRSNHPGWPRVTREMFVDPRDADTMVLAVASFGVDQIVRTTDRGQTFAALDQNLPDVPVNTVALDVRSEPPVIFAGTDAGLLKSLDDGLTWRPHGEGLPNAPVIDIRLELERGRIVVGTQGRGAWWADVEVGSGGFSAGGK